MPDMQELADAMLAAAATVLGRLVEQPAAAFAAARNDHEGSIKTDGDSLVALAEIPSLSAQVVVRFARREMQQIVGAMLGGADEGGEMGPMQLSIASETASQIASAMCERLATEVGTSTDGIVAELKSDPGALPPPPFESYDGAIQLGETLSPTLSIDFAAITLSRLGVGGTVEAAPAPVVPTPPVAKKKPAPAPQPEQEPVSARPVAFAPLAPTQVHLADPGQANLDLVHDVPLQIRAVLGKTAMALREVVSLQAGSVFELDKAAAEPIDLYVNNVLIARGEVVVVDDKYAVKISELNPPVA